MLAYSMSISVGVRMSCDLYWPPKFDSQIAGSIPMRQYAMNCPFPPAGLKWRPEALATPARKITGVRCCYGSARPWNQDVGGPTEAFHDLVLSIAGLEGEDAVHAVELVVSGDQVTH
jgi:hypothetical protein